MSTPEFLVVRQFPLLQIPVSPAFHAANNTTAAQRERPHTVMSGMTAGTWLWSLVNLP